MTETPSTSSGWHVRKANDASGWEGGPYSWEELVAYAREGRIQPADPVWHPQLPSWTTASAIPGLFQTSQPASPPAQSAAAPQPPAPGAAQQPGTPAAQVPPRKRRGWLTALIGAVVVILLAGGGFGVWTLLRDGGGAEAGPLMGAADTTLPDRAALIETAAWGEVPANQLAVMMAEGARRPDAERAAETIGGTVIGEIAFIGLYQVEFPGATEADLVAAIETIEAHEKVDYAYPNAQVHLDAEIWGVRVDPYDDPVYGGGAGDGYKAIGVSKAWTYIKGAGVDLEAVKVGVVDDGLYMPGEGAENEFEGGVNIEFPDEAAGELVAAELKKNGSVNEAGSHGTGVSTIIAGNPDNGGPSGVAGPLGKKLTVSMINVFAGEYGDTTSTPDPNDPTKQVWHDGKTYTVGALVAITKQIEAGAKVINCSWGNSEADPKDVETYTRFFTKMAEKHPDVLFVCSGGNGGQVMDGSKRVPSGLALPNMITVGALDNDGTTASYADKASANYEITLGAPGTQAVVGLKGAGGAERQNGSSFAAPQVTAAAAILKALNPKLTAGEIKAILTATARTSVANPNDPAAPPTAIAADMGGKILALDQAVLKVINDMRAAKGLPALDEATLEKMGVVDAVAVTGAAGEYSVRGIVEAAGEKGVTLKIEVFGENSAIGGKTEQSLVGAGEAKWSVTLPKDRGTIKVTRLDNGAASVIDIEQYDINGTWTGTYTLTNLTITDAEAAEKEGCSLAFAEALLNKPLPATLEITVNEDGQGDGVLSIDPSSLSEDADAQPNAVGISQRGSVVNLTFGETGVEPMAMPISRSGDTLTMTGSMGGGGPGFSWTAVMTFSKPYVPKQ